jgi:hypothetical protein
LAEWLSEGERRFGPDRLKWRFICPVCGHVEAVEDFRPFKATGATAESAYFNCIGRYAGPKRRAFGGDGPGPCDYTTGGLFNISPVTITETGGKPASSFEFAEAVTEESGVAA